MGENMVANGEHEKISIGRVLVSVSTPQSEGSTVGRGRRRHTGLTPQRFPRSNTQQGA